MADETPKTPPPAPPPPKETPKKVHKFNPRIQDSLDIIEWYAGAGLSDWQMAYILRISERKWYTWKRDARVLAVIKRGSEASQLIKKVERGLFRRAIGYEIVEEWFPDGTPKKIRHFAASEIAAMMYLSNRDPDNWKQRQEINATQNIRMVTAEWGKMTPEERAAYIEKAKAALGKLKGEEVMNQIGESEPPVAENTAEHFSGPGPAEESANKR